MSPALLKEMQMTAKNAAFVKMLAIFGGMICLWDVNLVTPVISDANLIYFISFDFLSNLKNILGIVSIINIEYKIKSTSRSQSTLQGVAPLKENYIRRGIRNYSLSYIIDSIFNATKNGVF